MPGSHAENGSHRSVLNSRNFVNLRFFDPILFQIYWGSSDELIAVAFRPHRLKIAVYPAKFREPFTKCTDDLHFQRVIQTII